jgi:Ca2+-binding RTX toxin-like protein
MFNPSLLIAEAKSHIGEEYYWRQRPNGSEVVADYDNPDYGLGANGGWDCAEFVTYCVYQAFGLQLGLTQPTKDITANGNQAHSGNGPTLGWYDYWQTEKGVSQITLADARNIPGAILIAGPGGPIGHVAISLGNGKIIEAVWTGFDDDLVAHPDVNGEPAIGVDVGEVRVGDFNWSSTKYVACIIENIAIPAQKFDNTNNTVKLTSSGEFFALGGDDHVTGTFGRDIIHGGFDNDTLLGSGGNDDLYGDAGHDWLYGGSGNNKLHGGVGIDGASYYSSSGVTAALDGSLAAKGWAIGDTYISIEKLEGSNVGADQLSGDSGNNDIWGLGGEDTLYGRAGSDWLFGGGAKDNVYGGTGDDFLHGGAGADVIDGGTGSDVTGYANATAGVTVSLDGSLQAKGEAIGDSFISIENIGGSHFADVLSGNNGANTIAGRSGNDKLYGRSGNDRFYFNSRSDGTDRIVDFTSGDSLIFENHIFGNLATGKIKSHWFLATSNNRALDANDYFIFNKAEHSLWYDVDGNGNSAAIKIAVLENDYNLTYAKVVIVDLF